ncbi:MAG: hypothetical protein MSG64_02170 [Pyrinomonadaceae bacterium MAG19_C2-C3]|nr:hypothetical protein [Pyrinomonadaceae bacterium MAG19_C2-C3]
MAVYEHRYQPYTGALTPQWSRFLIVPRHAFRDLFASKILTGFFALSFIPPLVFAILIYLHHNLSAIALLKINIAELVPIDESFFYTFIGIQSGAAFFLTLLVAPTLVSKDLANNALPLYLSRPFSRFEYTIGKMSVVFILLSCVMWIPGLVLFIFQSFLEGFAWMSANLWIAGSIFLSSWTWIIFLALLSQTLSAWVKWRVAASAGMVAAFLIPSAIAEVSYQILNEGENQDSYMTWLNIISPSAIMQTLRAALFRMPPIDEYAVPLIGAWLGFIVICAVLIFLLSRKVRAYEVA